MVGEVQSDSARVVESADIRVHHGMTKSLEQSRRQCEFGTKLFLRSHKGCECWGHRLDTRISSVHCRRRKRQSIPFSGSAFQQSLICSQHGCCCFVLPPEPTSGLAQCPRIFFFFFFFFFFWDGRMNEQCSRFPHLTWEEDYGSTTSTCSPRGLHASAGRHHPAH